MNHEFGISVFQKEEESVMVIQDSSSAFKSSNSS
jgi:hypothetical protein